MYMYSVHCTMYNVECALCNVHAAIVRKTVFKTIMKSRANKHFVNMTLFDYVWCMQALSGQTI